MIRAFIREDLPGMFLHIHLIQESDGMPRRILRIEDAGAHTTYRWEDLPERPGSDIAPTLQVGDSEARALLEALARHYGGAPDVQTLRSDYNAERKRVDTLTASLIGVAHALANKGTPEPVLTAERWQRIAGER